MEVFFKDSKDGNLTCSLGSINLHSSFNPLKEAERFIDLLSVSYSPSHIIITGACLGYVEPYLRSRFPQAKIISIQYSKEFSKYEGKWDKAFIFTEQSDINLINEELFSFIGEEKLFSTYFISWKASEKAWPDLASTLWASFKDLLGKAESVISTRAYFNKRWFKNSINFFTNANKICQPEKTDKAVIITASGPSLASTLPFLKENRDSYILLSASSSILPLLKNGIIPDFCISTDGGWWAKKHLEPLLRINKAIPLIIPPEAAVPKKILSTMPLVPLSYGDFPDKYLFDATKTPFIKGTRNGTVSGSAALLALSMTSGPVFFCGLDLAISNKYQHTQPNALELINSQKDKRTSPLETRCASSSLSGSSSLSIYRNWFSSRDNKFYERIFRLVTEKDKLESIPRMKDIYIEKTGKKLFPEFTCKAAIKLKEVQIDPKENERNVYHLIKKIKAQIETNPESPYNYEWYKLAALKDVIKLERTGDKTITNEIKEKTINLLDELISKKQKEDK